LVHELAHRHRRHGVSGDKAGAVAGRSPRSAFDSEEKAGERAFLSICKEPERSRSFAAIRDDDAVGLVFVRAHLDDGKGRPAGQFFGDGQSGPVEIVKAWGRPCGGFPGHPHQGNLYGEGADRGKHQGMAAAAELDGLGIHDDLAESGRHGEPVLKDLEVNRGSRVARRRSCATGRSCVGHPCTGPSPSLSALPPSG